LPVVIFNGPPGCGKDAACLFYQNIGYKHLSFKEELFKETFKFFGVSKGWFMKGYENRDIKEKPVGQLRVNGTSFSRRDAMIYVSEQFIKPKYGKDYFGKQLSKRMTEDGLFCVSDGGFQEELSPIINKFGAESITIIQLTREGCDFSSDSRRYFNGNLVQEFILGKETPIVKSHLLPDQFPIRTYRVHNNDSIESFYRTLQAIHEKESNDRKINQKEEGDTDKNIM
jgi:hypothetical protein